MDPTGGADGLAPRHFRARVRAGVWSGPTAGCCAGFVQANLVVIPGLHASDFLTFCQRNPAPCPLLEVLRPGAHEPRVLAPGADVRTDLPAYRLFRDGELLVELPDVLDIWRDDLVTFLLGCSFTFDVALREAGIPVRHVECGKNVPMYVTEVPCESVGVFSGPLVVSMRPIPDCLIGQVAAITEKFPLAHGAPVHIGDPGELGIENLDDPDFGDVVPVHKGETPVFWACGTTPQAVAARAKLDFMITHAPGHMFVTDLRYESL